MAASPAERSRAAYLRRKRAKGSLTIDESAWLVQYERDHPRGRGQFKSSNPPPKSSANPPTEPPENHTEPHSEPVAPATEPTNQKPAAAPGIGNGGEPGRGDEMVKIDFGSAFRAGAESAASASSGGKCQIENCPKCKVGSAGSAVQTCGTTGETVYPPMSIEGSKGMAGFGLNLIGWAVSLWRDDRKVVKPTEMEIDSMAGALRAVQVRRMNRLGAADDIIWFLMALGAYMHRASTEEGPS